MEEVVFAGDSVGVSELATHLTSILQRHDIASALAFPTNSVFLLHREVKIMSGDWFLDEKAKKFPVMTGLFTIFTVISWYLVAINE